MKKPGICIVIDLRGEKATLETLNHVLFTMSRFYGCEWPAHHFWVTREDIGRDIMFNQILEQRIISDWEKTMRFERYHEPVIDLYLPDRDGPMARIINFKLPEWS